jgi:hypothetical protein
MKTMISMDKKQIKRVTDDKAVKLYHDGWNYTTKSVWKEQVRDVNKKEETPKPVGEKTSNKLSKSQKRHMRKANK